MFTGPWGPHPGQSILPQDPDITVWHLEYAGGAWPGPSWEWEAPRTSGSHHLPLPCIVEIAKSIGWADVRLSYVLNDGSGRRQWSLTTPITTPHPDTDTILWGPHLACSRVFGVAVCAGMYLGGLCGIQLLNTQLNLKQTLFSESCALLL